MNESYEENKNVTVQMKIVKKEKLKSFYSDRYVNSNKCRNWKLKMAEISQNQQNNFSLPLRDGSGFVEKVASKQTNKKLKRTNKTQEIIKVVLLTYN